MPIIAPWLRPADVLGAMQAGASAGLQLRQQNIAAAEAEARRRQQDEALAAQQTSAAERLQFDREELAGRLSLAAAKAAQNAGQHQEALAFKTAAQALAARRENRLGEVQEWRKEESTKAKRLQLDREKEDRIAAGQKASIRLRQKDAEKFRFSGLDPTQQEAIKTTQAQIAGLAGRALEPDIAPVDKAALEAKIFALRNSLTNTVNALRPASPSLPASAAPAKLKRFILNPKTGGFDPVPEDGLEMDEEEE